MQLCSLRSLRTALWGVQEVAKIAHDVKALGMHLVVFAEWYNVASMMQMRFFDDNTRSWWTPVTGGVPPRAQQAIPRHRGGHAACLPGRKLSVSP